MSDSSNTPGQPDPRRDDWLLPSSEQDTRADTAPVTDRPSRRAFWDRIGTVWKAVALVVAGLLVGGGTVAAAQAITGDGTTVSASARDGWRGGPDGYGVSPGGGRFGDRDGFGRGGPVEGEQYVAGTIAGTTSTTVTVETTDGEEVTYAVTADSQLLRDGEEVEVGDLEEGEDVQLHVIPSGDDGDLVVERLFAGTPPTFDRDGVPGLPPGDLREDDGDDATTSTT